MRGKLKIRYIILIVLLSVVWATQLIPSLGEVYAQSVYPVISHILSSFSKLIPFAVGDLFIFLSIIGLLFNPIRARYIQKKKWKQILLNEMEYLLWIYVWFYLAWGLNYSQKDFYGRTNIPYTAYTPEIFQSFVDNYIDKLNASYTDITSIDEPLVCRESVRGYNQISDTLGVHRPPHSSLRVKTMLFTPFISMVGVTGSMGPFFCEFTLNGDLLPSQCDIHPRTGPPAGHHQRGRSQLLRLPGLHPFAGERDSFQWVFLRTPTCAGQCPPTDERRRIRRTFQPDTS